MKTIQSSFNALIPALDMLGKHIKVLPTSGGAMEDLEKPPLEEIEDDLINRDNMIISEFAERPAQTNPYQSTPPIYRPDKHLYQFFIDGSRSVYFLGTGMESNRSFPIALAQVGAALMQRDEQGRVYAFNVTHQLRLLIPKGPLGVSDSVWNELEAFNAQNPFLGITDLARDVPTDDPKNKKPARERLRSRAQGISSDEMHKLEVAAIRLTDSYRNPNKRLIIDGGVNWGELLAHPHMIGVAKHFSQHPQVRIGSKGAPMDIIRLIAHLPYAHRTRAFLSADRKLAFWYVRLRQPEHMSYALYGVIKVEIPLLGEEKIVNAEEIDLISRTLVAERNVTPYGQDHRWHCHLYPIFQAERAIKTKFYSSQVIRGMIRWPQSILA